MRFKILSIMLLAFTIIKAQVPSGQVASYNFTNGSLVNDVNSGNGDLSGGTPTLVTDRDGLADYAIRANAVARTGYTLSNSGNSYSISLWLQGGGPTGTSQRIFQVNDNNGNGFYLQNEQGSVLRCGFKNANVNISGAETIPDIYDGDWHNVLLTIDYHASTGYTNNLYVDGNRNSTISDAITTTNTGALLGNNSNFVLSPSSLVFYGSIDDINIYEKALNTTEAVEIGTGLTPGANKYYVDSTASGNNDGTSWSDAFTKLQTALTLSTTNTSQIWIAKGTYITGSKRESTFNIDTDGLSIYGGFEGTETTLSERDVIVNTTILSGDVNGNDSTLSSNHNGNSTRYENAYNVVNLNANNIIIDGINIEDGYANYNSSGEYSYGGAINIESTSENLTIRNCEINNNFSLHGGIRAYFDVDTEMNIENCKFNNNHARYGSGLYILVDENRTISLNITNTLFTNNSSLNIYGSGGYTGSSAWLRAIGTGSTLTTTINNCTFANNRDNGTVTSVTERGTLGLSSILDGTHNATINNSIFYGNVGTSINRGHSIRAMVNINYSIDENGFSNIAAANLSNTNSNDPLFTDTANNDYTLQAGSPAINTGDNTKVTSSIPTDLLGNDRIFNTTVDMGVYEFGSTSLDTEEIVLNTDYLVIYPNPTTNFINLTGVAIKSVVIYNALGQQVITTDATKINVASLLSGIYIVQIKTDKNTIKTKRFVKL